MKVVAALLLSIAVVLPAGCASESGDAAWTDDEVSFDADGLTIHGTYRHRGQDPGPAALLISESGNTDRNGDNQVAGPIGNMRQLAELLSERDVASLRYDKVGTGRTGLGRYATDPAAVVSGVYTQGAGAAVRFLATQPGTDADRISVYGLGEGTIHAMALAGDDAPDAPRIHALGLLQPLPGRYLDIITARVAADGAPETVETWRSAVDQLRTTATVPDDLPDGLTAIVNPANVAAVVEADKIDPLALAAAIPAGTRVLLTCSDADSQASCDAMRPLADALDHTDLMLVELTGVNHVLRDDPSDSIANYANQEPLSPQLVTALDEFVAS
ncbi:hypothetical protein [Mycobacterium sp. SMC-4]|uniref:hypothetical protein n=1 Tax=Mycobacterium sp. SMC-4 TaxID=2857059 RepID=UPI0021B316D9|nr:hypothetical protein [Mycobacterium sp. SMC-4]UXA18304.1 hypothetical protein KXD98_00780 [Mycobacterium sp. SMC-4]